MSPLQSVSLAAEVLAYGFFTVLSVVLALIDVRTHRLPDRLVLPAYPVAIVLLTVAAVADTAPLRLVGLFAGGLALFGFFLLLRMLRPGAMGGGDVKLAGVVGAYLGYLGWDVVLTGALAAFVLGGIFSVILLLARRARRGSAVPFGPWMLAGAWVAIVPAVVAQTAAL